MWCLASSEVHVSMIFYCVSSQCKPISSGDSVYVQGSVGHESDHADASPERLEERAKCGLGESEKEAS
jgi:hypothetical protein